MIITNFNVGELYSNRDIMETLRCTQMAYLRSRGSDIVAACLRDDENPDDVKEIWVGEGRGRRRLASDFLRQCRQKSDKTVPVFLKVNKAQSSDDVWEYRGRYRAVGEVVNAEEIAKRRRPKDPVVRVLNLERVGD